MPGQKGIHTLGKKFPQFDHLLGTDMGISKMSQTKHLSHIKGNQMEMYASFIGTAPIKLWGLTSHQRLQRILERFNVSKTVDDVETLPADSFVLLLRADYLFDERVIQALINTPNCLLISKDKAQDQPIAAHVRAESASLARDILMNKKSADSLSNTRKVTCQSLCSSTFQQQLKKIDPPSVEPITPDKKFHLEKYLFSGSYKGVTDLITKWVWPPLAMQVTRLCTKTGLKPNHVTLTSLVLVAATTLLFWFGLFGWGLLFGWIMTFLDTVDGKLARVTVNSSFFGNILDHGLDLIHPPIWYLAWGMGLQTFFPTLPWPSLSLILWLILAGYVAGRMMEGAFEIALGKFGIFCWRPFDSYFRLITARRNPNMLLLTAGFLTGHPDIGLLAVAVWTMATTFVLIIRLLMAVRVKITAGSLTSWLDELDPYSKEPSLATRIFTSRQH